MSLWLVTYKPEYKNRVKATALEHNILLQDLGSVVFGSAVNQALLPKSPSNQYLWETGREDEEEMMQTWVKEHQNLLVSVVRLISYL